MTPQLTKIAECLSESHAREIKLARCLAESLKRIQTIEAAVKADDKKTKPIEARLNAAIQVVAEKVTKNSEASLIELQSLKADANTKSKITEIRFQSALRDLAEQLTKQTAKNEELIRKMEEAIKVEFPAQLAALKAEFATPAAQVSAPQSFNPRGDYEAGEKYKPFDYVSSNGSSYIALVENPTQPPSKKSKQWMLVAARGAGGGGVTGLGTAAYRDVGQAAGNVLELSGTANVTLGYFDGVAEEYVRGSIAFYTEPGTTGLLRGPVTANENRTYDLPDASGTIALLSQVGDRYLTSSTTSNTVSNGAKTFTISTGLAYTPTQDITIVFNASNHMHASVTSYNSATGALVVDVNSHTGSGTYAVWTVNVGGIGAGAIPSGGTTGQVLAKVSATDYDDAWVTPTVAVGGVTGLGTSVATALAINVGTAGSPVVNGGALGTPSSGTVTNLSGTASININGTVGATTPASGAFTTLNASGLTRIGTATTADALSDVLIATSATTQRGLTIQGKASQTASLLRIVESSNNAGNNGWQFDANAVSWAGSGTTGGYINQAVMITQPGFFYKWNSSTTNVFSAATFSLGPTVAGSKILAIGNGTQFDTSGGISCATGVFSGDITSSSATDATTNSTTGAVVLSGGLAVAKSATIGPASGVQLRFCAGGGNGQFETWSAQTGTGLALKVYHGFQVFRATNQNSTLIDVFDNTTSNATTPYFRVRNSNGDFFQVGALGDISLTKTITAAGTTGAQTINKSSGSVNFVAGATSLVVTNSLVTVNSVIQLTVGSNDTTMKSGSAVAAAGSFTIYPNSAPTAETRVNFTITN